MAVPNPQIIAIRRQRIAQVRAALEAAKDLSAEFIGIEPIDEAISAALIACDETEDQVVGQSAECGHKRVGRPCPYCAKEVRAADVELHNNGDFRIVCGHCHVDLLSVEQR